MNRPSDDFDIPEMVPERDELVSRGRGVRGSDRRAAGNASARHSGGGLGAGARFLLVILTLGLLATGAAAYVFYTEGSKALASLEDANKRLMALEERLSAVGESSEETALNIVERVDSNFSEIDKLWAARNKNVASISAHEESITAMEETLASLSGTVEAQASTLDGATSLLNDTKSQVDNITANIDSLETLDLELTRIREQLRDVQAGLDGLRPLGNRLTTAEEDIESINVYRLQLNQTISTLQDQVRNLQQSSISSAQ